jgi:hypothetical protein
VDVETTNRAPSNDEITKPSARNGLPDLAEWDVLPSTQLVPEKGVLICPYIGGSRNKPRDIRTLRRWRESRRGPSYRKIGGRFFYEVAALRAFFGRCERGCCA